tara:strand:- start:6104 stop:6364 length:261 start_codon:yes stop_codon:yes gene_type:complete
VSYEKLKSMRKTAGVVEIREARCVSGGAGQRSHVYIIPQAYISQKIFNQIFLQLYFSRFLAFAAVAKTFTIIDFTLISLINQFIRV